jgi:hypothetical protein
MSESGPHWCTKADLAQVARRIGIPDETIAEITAQLPDPFDVNEAGGLLQSYGITRDAIISWLGGSP